MAGNLVEKSLWESAHLYLEDKLFSRIDNEANIVQPTIANVSITD